MSAFKDGGPTPMPRPSTSAVAVSMARPYVPHSMPKPRAVNP